VTDNLHRLLRHLRLRDESRRLWIDQICINQKDEVEKGAQIRLMTEIYAGASPVVIWL
ncbi:heterokaryon incompatibility, partial [Parathielavia appendiculata]